MTTSSLGCAPKPTYLFYWVRLRKVLSKTKVLYFVAKAHTCEKVIDIDFTRKSYTYIKCKFTSQMTV